MLDSSAATLAVTLTLAAGIAVLPPTTSRSEPSNPTTESVVGTLPFLPAPPNRILVDVAPEGNRRRFPVMLDTGATNTVLTPGKARELGVRVKALKRDPYRRRTALGRDLLFHVDTRRSDTGISGGGFEHALLGGDFLANYVLELDFEQHQVRFLDPRRFEVPAEAGAPDETVLPLEVVSNRPAVTVQVQGTPLLLLLDTGAPLGVMLSGEFAAKASVASAPRAGFQIRGVRGAVATEVGRAAKLELGDVALDDVPVVVAPNGFHNLGFAGDSILGVDVLSQFLVRIDYPRKRLWLRRRSSPEVPPTPVDVAAGSAPKGDAPATREPRFLFDPDAPSPVQDMAWVVPAEPTDAMVALAPRGEAPTGPQVWLEWEAPTAGTRVEGPVGWVEVKGWAGVGNPVQHDVVIVLDVSGSTAIASGVDVDEDGKLGKKKRRVDTWRSFNPRHLSSDPDDTILAAELLATRRLIELLNPDRTRIGLVAFSGGARILAPLGSDGARIDQVLTDLEGAFGSGATNLEEAIRRGTEVLVAGADPGGDRRRTLLLLSDGFPTAPGSEALASEKALEAAQAAADAEIRIDAFGLGLEALGDDDVYTQIARVTQGEYLRLEEPGAVLHELPRIDLADVAAIEITNASSGQPARALRVRPDGSFDAFLRLAEGENEVRITARGEMGGETKDARSVVFESRDPTTPEEAQAFERRVEELKLALQQRRLETELAAEIEAARKQRRTLELEAEE